VTDYYVDASALVKRYAEESGSSWGRQITEFSFFTFVFAPIHDRRQ